MANIFENIDMITQETLAIMHEKCSFLKTCNMQYSDQFAQTGHKIGEQLRIRKPVKFTVRSGENAVIQDIQQESTILTMTRLKGIDIDISTVDETLKIDDFATQFLEPAAKLLVSDIEAEALNALTPLVPNVCGTAGTVVGTGGDTTALGLARAILHENLAPTEDVSAIIDARTMASIVNADRTIFHAKDQIETGYLEGYVGRTQGARFYENQRTWTMNNSADVAGTLNTYTITQGDADISVTGFSVAPTAGMIFTIAGVYACHDETKQPTGQLKQFVALAGSTSSTILTYPIYLTGAKKNVVNSAGGTLDPSTITTNAVTFFGSASGIYRQNLMYHKNAFAFVTADLAPLRGGIETSKKKQDGLSISMSMGSDIMTRRNILRLDILYGFAPLYPEWAVRISN